MGNTKTVKVGTQKKAKRTRKHWIKGHWARLSKPFRRKQHMRNARSTKSQIKKRGGTRKQVRKR